MNDRGDRLQRLLPGLPGLLWASPARAAEGGLEIVPDPALLGLLILVFVLLIGPVNVLVFRPVFRVLDAREKRIAGTRLRADQVAREAEEVTVRYEEALSQAREEAARDRAGRVEAARREGATDMAAAREEAERRIEAARRELAAALADARGALRGQAESLAREAAARLLGRAL